MFDNKPINTFEPKIVKLPNWLEECSDLYLNLIRNPTGIGFPDKYIPETKIEFVQQIIQVNAIEKFIDEHNQDNLWRSWKLFTYYKCENSVGYVPLIIDIDNGDKNLVDAYILTLKCLDLILMKKIQNISKDNLRVVFSGMKGFHIEARPEHIISCQDFRKDIIHELIKDGVPIKRTENEFQFGVIDPLKDFVRLTGSFNNWMENGIVKKRKVIQFSLEEFRNLSIEKIIAGLEIS